MAAPVLKYEGHTRTRTADAD